MPERTIARAVVFRGDRVLLVRRSPDQRIAPGVWQCPAGKQEPGEAIEQTLARELHEETALDVLEATPLGVTSTEFVTEGVPTTWHQHSYLVTASEGNIVLSSEHCDYRWVPLDKLDDFTELTEWVRAVIGRAAITRRRLGVDGTPAGEKRQPPMFEQPEPGATQS